MIINIYVINRYKFILYCAFRKYLVVLTISFITSNFRAWMHKKGDTEPGWRIITGCVCVLYEKMKLLELLSTEEPAQIRMNLYDYA